MGRGLIQLTWKGNYEQYKSATGIDCIASPELISDNITNSCDVSGWYWENRNLNRYADNDDLLMVSYRVNGPGFYGVSERYRFTKQWIERLNVKLCPDYDYLQLGEYSLETSDLKNSNYIHENGTTNIARENSIKKKLSDAKKEYTKYST